MTSPGDFAALYDALAAEFDDLVAREEAKRSELAPLRSYLRVRSDSAPDVHHDRRVAAVALDAQVEELHRMAERLDRILQGVFALALLDHSQAAHPPTGTP
jgi:hypothetical protein